MKLIICLHCADFSFQRTHPTHAKAGLGCCEHREKFILFAARLDRDCEKFARADLAVIAKREKFLRGG